MKNILVLIHEDPGQNARVEAALDLGRALGGHLSCVSVSEPPVILPGDFYGAGAQAVLVDNAAQEEAAENRERIEALLEAEDVPWTMTQVSGSLGDALVINAGLADLIVLNTRGEGAMFPDMRALAADVLIQTKKPVLAVPASLKRFDAFAPAIVAWDGSPPAFAALRAAVPLLRMAANVTLLQIGDGADASPAEGAATYLSRHGIRAKILRKPDDGEPIALAIAEECWRREAICVMGAFGRSRLSEAIFGGVTRWMLANSPGPLLLAH